MEKPNKGKKKVNHRKYIQKRMKSVQKPKPLYTPASAKISLTSKGRKMPSITMKASMVFQSGEELPPWISFSSVEKGVVPSPPYQACCDPQVDQVLSAFESSDIPVDSPRSCGSDPFSPYSSTVSESGEDYTFDANFGSPSYQIYVEDCGYCSDISQFSPSQKYW